MTGAIETSAVDAWRDLQTKSREELIEAIRQGLPAELARQFADALDITQDQFAPLLRLTPRTLQRRLEDGRLDFAESERLWELARVFFRAVEVLESEPAAVQWFKSPIQALGWKSPLDLAQTSIGLREIEQVLGRIEQGVFS